jgi:hypothetical protein
MSELTAFLRECIDGRIVDSIMRYEAKIDGEWGCGHGPKEIEGGLCPDGIGLTGYNLLRLLALPFSNSTGYNPDWTVDD